jgi:hypothetical protein
MPASSSVRAIDLLKKAANLTPSKKSVVLHDGTEFVFHCAPMTAADRDRARSAAKSDDAQSILLQLLLQKAVDENGQRMFSAGDAADLRNAVRNDDLQSIFNAMMEVEEEIDPKS